MTYGMKVSIPGKDISSTTPTDFSFNSEYFSIKISSEGSGTKTVADGASEKVTIAHGLSFTPMCMVFTELATGHWYCGVCIPSQADGFPSAYLSLDPHSSDTYADGTNLNFTIVNNTGSSKDVDYYYYIFADNGI
jgi:hypothetical protein